MNDIISSQRRPHTPIPNRSAICGRLGRLHLLTSDQVEAGMAWLAGYDPVVFDAVIDAARTWDDSPASPHPTATPTSH